MANAYEKKDISFAENFAVCVCAGIRPDKAHNLLERDYSAYTKLNLSVYDRIAKKFKERGLGEEIKRDAYCVHILCVLPLEDLDKIRERIEPVIADPESSIDAAASGGLNESVIPENSTEYNICAGIGIPAYNALHIEESDASAVRAFEMFYFEQKQITEFLKCGITGENSGALLDKYGECLDEAFRAILIKSDDALCVIDGAIDTICRIHFGNKRAFSMRCMNFTGELADRLRRYKLLEDDINFFSMQDELQTRVLEASSADDVKLILHEFYEEFLPKIFSLSRTSRKSVIDKVITYMKENFMEDINIDTLSSVACVSPNYFSHMFKNETGRNFKDYLTEIRMAEALKLLGESDYKVYEISEKVGYRNVRTFVGAFTKKYGKGPGDYRKS